MYSETPDKKLNSENLGSHTFDLSQNRRRDNSCKFGYFPFGSFTTVKPSVKKASNEFAYKNYLLSSTYHLVSHQISLSTSVDRNFEVVPNSV